MVVVMWTKVEEVGLAVKVIYHSRIRVSIAACRIQRVSSRSQTIYVLMSHFLNNRSIIIVEIASIFRHSNARDPFIELNLCKNSNEYNFIY